MGKAFTDRYIATRKPKAARYEIAEPGGLRLRVTPSGKKTWTHRYRFARKPRNLTLGAYPAASLAKARVLLAEAKQNLAHGVDPGVDILEANRVLLEAPTVSELVDRYVSELERRGRTSATEVRRNFDHDVIPKLGHHLAHTVQSRQVRSVLNQIADRGSPIMANRTHARLRTMFAWAIRNEEISGEVNPVARLDPPGGDEPSRERTLDPKDVRVFWQALENSTLHRSTVLALRLTLVVGQRPGEVTTMPVRELNLDEAIWELPSARTKNRNAHIVPLSDLATSIIGEALADNDGSKWLFPSPVKSGSPVTRSTLAQGMRNVMPGAGLAGLAPHDLRRTCGTAITRLGFGRHIMDRVLNHVQRSNIGAIYDRHEYLAEKRAALTAWSAEIQRLLGREPTQDVVPIRPAG